MEDTTARATFAERSKDLRKKRGLTQTELAEQLGLSRGSVSYYEQCSRVPDIETLANYASFFNVSTEYLLGRSNDPSRKPSAIDDLGLTEQAAHMLKRMAYLADFDEKANINLIFENNEFCNLVYFISEFIFATKADKIYKQTMHACWIDDDFDFESFGDKLQHIASSGRYGEYVSEYLLTLYQLHIAHPETKAQESVLSAFPMDMSGADIVTCSINKSLVKLLEEIKQAAEKEISTGGLANVND